MERNVTTCSLGLKEASIIVSVSSPPRFPLLAQAYQAIRIFILPASSRIIGSPALSLTTFAVSVESFSTPAFASTINRFPIHTIAAILTSTISAFNKKRHLKISFHVEYDCISPTFFPLNHIVTKKMKTKNSWLAERTILNTSFLSRRFEKLAPKSFYKTEHPFVIS